MYDDPDPAMVSPAWAAGPTRTTDAKSDAVATDAMIPRINFSPCFSSALEHSYSRVSKLTNLLNL
jgi:hypothetical protein